MRDLFYGHMSERAGRILREDLELMGPVRLREVEEAQSALVMLAKTLSERGEIVLTDNRTGDEELVY